MSQNYSHLVNVTLTPQTSIGEVLRVFDQTDAIALAVLDRGRFHGVVTRESALKYSPSPANSLSQWELNFMLEEMKLADTKLISEASHVDYKWNTQHKVTALLDSHAPVVAVMNENQFSHLENWRDLLSRLAIENSHPKHPEMEVLEELSMSV